ncbi:MAG: methyltransferase domain-containing protein [Firmicutes bacterium]|nr:methyltransferase domain-containing protein [Bacillota bacterium]
MPQKELIKKKEISYDLPGRELKLCVVENIEALITDVNDPDKVPCWADIWPAAYGLARYLWEEVHFPPGARVLELGTGLGLPGIVCSLKGAQAVLSDFNPLALELAHENARRNGADVELLLEDWRTFACREKFDYLLAADILYEPRLNPFLGEIFCRNLKPGGKLFVSHPERRVTADFLEEWYNPRFFTQQKILREVELEGTLLPCYDIAIHILKFLPEKQAKRV